MGLGVTADGMFLSGWNRGTGGCALGVYWMKGRINHIY